MTEPRGQDPANPRNHIVARSTLEDRSGEHFAAPLGSSRSGRLRFTNGAHRIVIRADSHMRSLCRARFGDRMPMIGVRGGVVTIRYPRVLACDWLDCRSECPAEVLLNARIPWDVEVRGCASRLVAYLRGLRLGSLSLDGGTSRLEVVLPAPSGTMAGAILGGASNVAIRRTDAGAARLRVDGGATHLKFDDRHIAVAGGELELRSRDYDVATGRYDITITGGANNVSIDKQRGAKDRGRGALT